MTTLRNPLAAGSGSGIIVEFCFLGLSQLVKMELQLVVLEVFVPRYCILGKALKNGIQVTIIELFCPVSLPVEAVQPHHLVVAELLNCVDLLGLHALDSLGDPRLVQSAIASLVVVNFLGDLAKFKLSEQLLQGVVAASLSDLHKDAFESFEVFLPHPLQTGDPFCANGEVLVVGYAFLINMPPPELFKLMHKRANLLEAVSQGHEFLVLSPLAFADLGLELPRSLLFGHFLQLRKSLDDTL